MLSREREREREKRQVNLEAGQLSMINADSEHGRAKGIITAASNDRVNDG